MAESKSGDQLNKAGVAIVVGLVAAWIIKKVLDSRRAAAGGGKLRKQMSFTSAACSEGAFPVECNMTPAIINTPLLFTDPPTKQAVEKALSPFENYERFRSVAVRVDGLWYFEDTGSLDITKHVFEEEFNGTDEELFRRFDELAMKPLTVGPDLPPFEMIIIKNKGRGYSAAVFRISHSIGDGIALSRMIQVIFKDSNGGQLPAPEKYVRKEKNFSPKKASVWELLSCLKKVLTLGMTPYDTDIGLVPADRKNLKFTGTRKTIRFPILKMDFIKALKNKANVTVNDVLYSTFAGALHRYRVSLEDPIILDPNSADKVLTRALMPVALPRQVSDPTKALRNKWSFASVEMHVGIKDSLERLLAVNKETSRVKDSPVIPIRNAFEMNAGKILPWKVSKQLALDTFCRHSLVFSNVPGPDGAISFAGKEVKGIYMLYANMIPQVGALSLGGRLYTCIILDPEVTKEADKLPGFFIEEVKELAKRLGVDASPEDIYATPL